MLHRECIYIVNILVTLKFLPASHIFAHFIITYGRLIPRIHRNTDAERTGRCADVCKQSEPIICVNFLDLLNIFQSRLDLH